MCKMFASRYLLLALTLVFVACDDDEEIGTPCESEADCSEALICDIHEGQGTCQHDHGHRVETPPDRGIEAKSD
jgi:hypothetical protein